MPEYDLYRRWPDSLYHSRVVTIEADNVADLVGKLNGGAAGVLEVAPGDTLLVRQLNADAINTIQVDVPKPRFTRV
jgi:hypothetical protein